MSVAKPFVFAFVCEALGDEEARQKLGVNATGFPFDSLAAVERSADGRSNPMVNAGAIAAASLVPGGSSAAKWLFLRTSGDWLFDVGVPGKSGIAGGIVAVSPGKGGLGTFSPLLDQAGNSVRGQLAARHLSRTLGLSLFASKEQRPHRNSPSM
jgi:glutaminase